MLFQFRGMPQQLREVVEGIGSIEVTCVDQAHEQIAYPGAVHRLIEELVLAVQNGFFRARSAMLCRLPDYAVCSDVWRSPLGL